MDSLRLILILAGLLVVGIIYFLGRRREQKNAPSDIVENSIASPETAESNDDWDSLSFSTADNEPLDDNASPLLATLRQGAKFQKQQLDAAALDSLHMSPDEHLLTESDEVREEIDAAQEWYVVLTVMANEGGRLQGEAIHDALEEAGMHFGEMDIYHDYASGNQGVSLLSIANIVEPGTLRPDDKASLVTPGLALLLRLPTVLEGLQALERMLDTATQLAEKLNGHICDQQRLILSEESIEELRQKARDYPALPVLSAEVE